MTYVTRPSFNFGAILKIQGKWIMINGQIIVIAAGLVAMAVLLKTYAAGVLAATAAG